MAVLPTPGSPTKIGLFLRRRASTWMVRSSSSARPISGSMRPVARALHEVHACRRPADRRPSRPSRRRRRAASSPPSDRPRAALRRVLAILLGDAVRDVVEHVEPRDALLLEQVDRVRVALAIERRPAGCRRRCAPCPTTARASPRAAARARTPPSAAARARLPSGSARAVLVEERLEVASAASSRRRPTPCSILAATGSLVQREQHVLERDELVPPPRAPRRTRAESSIPAPWYVIGHSIVSFAAFVVVGRLHRALQRKLGLLAPAPSPAPPSSRRPRTCRRRRCRRRCCGCAA